MANVIIFTDFAPKTWRPKNYEKFTEYLSYTAGAYAIASHLRSKGYSVLVVPHAIKFSLNGVKKIINNNSKDLLWVGMSSSFMFLRAVNNNLRIYQKDWIETEENYCDISTLYAPVDKWSDAWVTELVWGTECVNLLSEWLKEKHQVPFVIGGSWITHINNGGLGELSDNVHLVTGNAERYVEQLSQVRQKGQPWEFTLVNNDEYDNNDFKTSSIIWHESDNVLPTDWLPIEVSRGCAFNCAYCNYDRKSNFEAYKNPQTLREELIRNYEQWGVTKYILMDDLYNDSTEKVEVLYDQVWSRLPFEVEWVSYMRLDMLWRKPRMAELIKASGAKLGAFGIETLHKIAGRKVGKGLGKERIFETLEMLKQMWGQDVLVFGTFISGLPDEPEESILETIDWLKTTDLLYGYCMNPLWITPPSHKERVAMKLHLISKDNEKYKIKWNGDVWYNNANMNFVKANELSLLANTDIKHGSFTDYVDLRVLGFTHDELANFDSIPDEILIEKFGLLSDQMKLQIDKKLKKIIAKQDI